MRPYLWIMVFTLFIQVYAQTTDSTEIVDFSGMETDEESYTLEQLINEDIYNETSTGKEEAHTSNLNEKLDQFYPPINGNNKAREGRLLGGTDATAGQFAYYVYVEGTPATGSAISCGGALLSETWVLTAAQCVVTAATVTVYAGVVVSPAASTSKSTATTYIHPSFKRNFMIHDIALLRLLSPLTLGANIGTIRLSSRDTASGMDNVAVRTFGFGVANNDVALAMAPQMKYVDLVNLKKSTCLTQTLETYVSYPKHTGCLATSAATKGFCYGDTGGPVIYTSDSDATARVIGVNSQYLGCPSSYPSSYTRLFPYLGWIKTITRKNFT